MGQKTHPIGLRVGLHRRWNNSWYGDNRIYKNLFFAQNQLEQFLKGFLYFYNYTKKSLIKRALLVNTRFIKPSTFNLYIFAFFYKFRIKKKFFTFRKIKRYKFNRNRFVMKAKGKRQTFALRKDIKPTRMLLTSFNKATKRVLNPIYPKIVKSRGSQARTSKKLSAAPEIKMDSRQRTFIKRQGDTRGLIREQEKAEKRSFSPKAFNKSFDSTVAAREFKGKLVSSRDTLTTDHRLREIAKPEEMNKNWRSQKGFVKNKFASGSKSTSSVLNEKISDREPVKNLKPRKKPFTTDFRKDNKKYKN